MSHYSYVRKPSMRATMEPRRTTLSREEERDLEREKYPNKFSTQCNTLEIIQEEKGFEGAGDSKESNMLEIPSVYPRNFLQISPFSNKWLRSLSPEAIKSLAKGEPNRKAKNALTLEFTKLKRQVMALKKVKEDMYLHLRKFYIEFSTDIYTVFEKIRIEDLQGGQNISNRSDIKLSKSIVQDSKTKSKYEGSTKGSENDHQAKRKNVYESIMSNFSNLSHKEPSKVQQKPSASQYFDKGTKQLTALLRENYRLKTDIKILESRVKQIDEQRKVLKDQEERLEKWDAKLKKIAEEVHRRNDEIENEKNQLHKKNLEMGKNFQKINSQINLIESQYRFLQNQKRKLQNLGILIKKREQILGVKENMIKDQKKLDPYSFKNIQSQKKLPEMALIKAMIESNTNKLHMLGTKKTKTPKKQKQQINTERILQSTSSDSDYEEEIIKVKKSTKSPQKVQKKKNQSIVETKKNQKKEPSQKGMKIRVKQARVLEEDFKERQRSKTKIKEELVYEKETQIRRRMISESLQQQRKQAMKTERLTSITPSKRQKLAKMSEYVKEGKQKLKKFKQHHLKEQKEEKEKEKEKERRKREQQ